MSERDFDFREKTFNFFKDLQYEIKIFYSNVINFIQKFLNFWNILDNRNRSIFYKDIIKYKKYISSNLYKPLLDTNRVYFPRVKNRGRKISRNSHRSALDRVFLFSSSSYRLLSVILIVRECLHTNKNVTTRNSADTEI